MRLHGTLTKWNDDRGFGFVVLPQSHEEIFVHISAFPKDGVRPRIGETISFEVRSAPDGRKRAEEVLRPGARAAVRNARDVSARSRRHPLRTALTVAVVVALGAAGYNKYASLSGTRDGTTFAIPQASQSVEEQPIESAYRQFECDGRTHCSQMTSCGEAMYFLNNCPNTEMDGNNDGEPCEKQWCN